MTSLPVITQTELEAKGFNPRRPDFLDSSSLKAFINCPSFYYLRYVLGLVRKRVEPGVNASRDWGSCWHEVMEAYYRGGGDLHAAIAAIEQHYPTDIQPSTDRYKRSKDRMAQGLFGYVERFADLDNEMEIIRNEQAFQVYSEEDDLEWSGRIDQIRRRKGKVICWDFKTTSSMGPSYFDQFELSFQFPGYVWATRQITSEQVNEICIDVFYTISKQQDYFRRTFRYTEAELAEWVQNVKYWRDLLWWYLDNHLYEPEKWPKNWEHCNWHYGRRCPFWDVHSLSPEGDTRLEVLVDDYKEERWHPEGADGNGQG